MLVGMLAIGNGEKCPFCDLINEEDLDILGHMIEDHKEDINKAFEQIKKMNFNISDISTKTVNRNPTGPFTT